MENLTLIIPFRNGHATINQLLDCVPSDMPIVIVDDVSDSPYSTHRPNVKVLRRLQRGYFSGAVNEGIRSCTTDILVLNQDILLEGTEWLNLLNYRANYGIIGDGVLAHPAHTLGYVQGTFMFVRRDVIEKVGLLNEIDYPLWGATCEYQLRTARAGFKVLPLPMSQYGLKHLRGDKSFGSAIAETLKQEPENKANLIKTPPAISVIITSYNYGRFVKDAVNSLVGGPTSLGTVEPQSFQSFEIVLVDDASTDETKEVCQDLEDPFKGIYFVARETKGGSAAAANSGAKAAHGRYLTVLDADDMMEPTRLEKLYRTAIANPHRIIYDDLYLFKRGQRIDKFTLSSYDFEKTLYRNQMHKGIFYERSAFDDVGGYPEVMDKGREDWAINIAFGAKGYCGVHLNEPLYLYRREGQNRSLTNTGEKFNRIFLSQLQGLYPRLFAGERSAMCCGQGKAKSSNGNGAQMQVQTVGRFNAMNELPGQQGFVQLEYLLDRAGPQQYRGSTTGAIYVFGGQRKVGYVDPRDEPDLLNQIEGHKKAFRRVVAAAPTPPPVAVPAVEVITQPDTNSIIADWQTGAHIEREENEIENVAMLESEPKVLPEPDPTVVTITGPVISEPTTIAKSTKPRAPRKSTKVTVKSV